MVFNPGLPDVIKNSSFGLFSQASTGIEAIIGIVDIYTDESHSMAVVGTKYPVEDGSSRVDNFVVQPEKLTLKGLVSDLNPSPLALIQTVDRNRSKEAWEAIRALKDSGELTTVITILGMYENMMVTNADAVVNEGTGISLSFSISLEEVIISETETVQLAPVKLSGPAGTKGSTINGGRKQAVEPSTTILQDIASGISGIF